MLRKTGGQKVKQWLFSDHRRSMDHPFNQASHQAIKEIVGCKVDLLKKNNNTEEVRIEFRVKLEPPLVNKLELPYIIPPYSELKSVYL